MNKTYINSVINNPLINDHINRYVNMYKRILNILQSCAWSIGDYIIYISIFTEYC